MAWAMRSVSAPESAAYTATRLPPATAPQQPILLWKPTLTLLIPMRPRLPLPSMPSA